MIPIGLVVTSKRQSYSLLTKSVLMVNENEPILNIDYVCNVYNGINT